MTKALVDFVQIKVWDGHRAHTNTLNKEKWRLCSATEIYTGWRKALPDSDRFTSQLA
jgi:hypothetical protein